MKKMTIKEQKRVMIEILEYFDSICRKNNIKYSLIGGSLIGAIRHKGIIPWDDDIDVVLDKYNYRKIVEILKKDNNPKYKLLTKDRVKDYYFSFPKLVATNTFVREEKCLQECKQYGIFIDILYYNNLPKDNKLFKKLKLLNSLLSRKKLDFKNESFKQNFLRFNKNLISLMIGYNNILKMKNRLETNNVDDKYAVITLPLRSIEKEYQLNKNIKEYIDVPFENIKAMIYKNYDEILKTTFGDYMQLPPKSERTIHGLEAYWRDK